VDRPDAADKSSFTATRRNAMSAGEVDAFLARALPARLATFRADGLIHLTPVWFTWERPSVYFVLGESRRHLKNLRRDPRATLLVDVDRRAEGAGTVCGVMMAGTVTISSEPETVAHWSATIDRRYLGEQVEDNDESNFPERYHLVTLVPKKSLTWDFEKAGDR
jgi:PPOX class probable F420-dependent enzyme